MIFFFQAEDGIRDGHVTGVQTCALPIYEKFLKEKSRLEKAAQIKMQKANKIAQAGNMSKKEAKAKANRMFETKSKGTSQKSVYRAAKARSEERRVGKECRCRGGTKRGEEKA